MRGEKKKAGNQRDELKTPSPSADWSRTVADKFDKLQELQGSLSARSTELFEEIYLAIDDLGTTLDRTAGNAVSDGTAIDETSAPSSEEVWALVGRPQHAQVLIKLLSLTEEDGVYLSEDPEYKNYIKLLVALIKCHTLQVCNMALERQTPGATTLTGTPLNEASPAMIEAGVYKALKVTILETVKEYKFQLQQQRASRLGASFEDARRSLELEAGTSAAKAFHEVHRATRRAIRHKRRPNNPNKAPRHGAATDVAQDPPHSPLSRLAVNRAVLCYACDLLYWLANLSPELKVQSVTHGTIKPLVDLLRAKDPTLMQGAAKALRYLAYNDREKTIKEAIVKSNGIEPLVLMLRSPDDQAQTQAIGCLGNLVHSCGHIKQEVLRAEALQPVIALLSSKNPDCRKEAALLVGQFANAAVQHDDSWKVRIAQRGAIPPLVKMLSDKDSSFPTIEYAAFALGRIAHSPENRSGLVEAGAIRPLLRLVRPPVGQPLAALQHNATFALYGLSDVDDHLPRLVREGAVMDLLYCKLETSNSMEYTNKMIARLYEKLRHPSRAARLIDELAILLSGPDPRVREIVARDLVHILPLSYLEEFYVRRGGLATLLGSLTRTDPMGGAVLGGRRGWEEGLVTVSGLVVSLRSLLKRSQALVQRAGGVRGRRMVLPEGTPKVGSKRGRAGDTRISTPLGGATGASAIFSPPALDSPPGGDRLAWGILVDSGLPLPEGADVRFVTESGECFAHRSRLVAASEYFRAMFTGPFADASLQEARFEVPHLEALACVLRFIYGAGRPDVPFEHAQSVLELANMYLLEDLVSACGERLAEGLSYETLGDLYDLARHYHCTTLAEHCAAYAVLHGEEILENWELEAVAGPQSRQGKGRPADSGMMDVSEGAGAGREASEVAMVLGGGDADASGSDDETVDKRGAEAQSGGGGGGKGRKMRKTQEEGGTKGRTPERIVSSQVSAETAFLDLLRRMTPDLYRLLTDSIEEVGRITAERGGETADPMLRYTEVEGIRRIVQGHLYKAPENEVPEPLAWLGLIQGDAGVAPPAPQPAEPVEGPEGGRAPAGNQGPQPAAGPAGAAAGPGPGADGGGRRAFLIQAVEAMERQAVAPGRLANPPPIGVPAAAGVPPPGEAGPGPQGNGRAFDMHMARLQQQALAQQALAQQALALQAAAEALAREAAGGQGQQQPVGPGQPGDRMDEADEDEEVLGDN